MQKSKWLFGPLAISPSSKRGWLANPLALDGFTNRQTALLFAAIAVVAALFGLITVGIGEVFSARPVFYLALPLVVVLVIAVVLDPQRLLVALVLLRAVLDPVFQRATLPGIGGLGGLLNFVIIGLALTLLAIERGKEMTRESWLPWVPFIVVIAIGVARSPDRVLSVRSLLSWLTYAAVYHGAFYCVRNLGELDRLLRWFLLSSVPVFAYAVFSILYFGPSYQLEAGDGSSPRLSDPVSHPNILAFYTVVMLGIWLVKIKSDPSKPGLTLRSIGWSAHLVMLLAMLAGTQTRSAWFGALFLFLVYGVFVKRSYLVMIVVASVLALMVPDIRDRVVDLGSGNEVYTYAKLNSYAWRQYLWSSALSVMSPLAFIVGNGQGSFWAGSITFFPLAAGENWNAHNVFMELLFDTGIVGVIAYLSVFGMAARAIWLRAGVPREMRIAVVSLIGCLVFMSYSDNMLSYLVVNWNFWFFIGLVTAASGSRKIVGRSHGS